MLPHMHSLESISDALLDTGYAIVPDFLPAAEVALLQQQALALQYSGGLQLAGTGQGVGRAVRSEVRGDEIHWIDEDTRGNDHLCYLRKLESLRAEVNRTLALGLFEFEGHFAVYPPGAFYRKHLDQFQTDSRRTLTCILYLNSSWHDDDGGQLRIHLDEENPDSFLDVLPTGGTLVTFLSSRYWHEVLPATRERISLTGWYKTRSEVPF